MARMNIYVPDDLKARMDAAGEAINWSEVARPAFRSAIADHEHHRENSMDSAIERLRASKAAHEAEQAKLGEEAGRDWGRDSAEYDELRRVADIPDHIEDALEALHDAIDPDNESDDFAQWLGVDARDLQDPAFIEGFIKGAQTFYDEVKRKL